MTNLEQLQQIIKEAESEHIEFKSARNNFASEDLFKYCCALSNEGGGHLILGVSNKLPRQIVGTNVFPDINAIKKRLLDTLKFRVEVYEIFDQDKRVLVFSIPGRPIGVAREYQGRYLMRAGESLVSMTSEVLQRIYAEATPDYSAEFCEQATLNSLSSEAIEKFRQMWIRKSGNEALADKTSEQLLSDAQLIFENKITYAALILLGEEASLRRFLPQAELIFEYRSSNASIEFQERVEFHSGFFLWADDIWHKINARNEVQSYRDGLFRYEIPILNEDVVREALLNAVAHREYKDGGSIFVRQYPRQIQIISPGGFPDGITIENIIHRQYPRNRRISEALQFCGLIERSGQGVDRIFGLCIQEGKKQPDYSASDSSRVSLLLDGNLKNPEFVEYLNRLSDDRGMRLAVDDFLVLDAIREGHQVEDIHKRIPNLLEQGVIEKTGRGRGTRYILTQALYRHVGQAGTYTRKRGLDKSQNEELLLQHIRNSGGEGATIAEFQQVLPNKTRPQISGLLSSLKKKGKIEVKGKTKGARWYIAQREQVENN